MGLVVRRLNAGAIVVKSVCNSKKEQGEFDAAPDRPIQVLGEICLLAHPFSYVEPCLRGSLCST